MPNHHIKPNQAVSIRQLIQCPPKMVNVPPKRDFAALAKGDCAAGVEALMVRVLAGSVAGVVESA